MTDILVSNRAELVKALQACKGGETIVLADGAWEQLTIGKPIIYPVPVTIRPQTRNGVTSAGMKWSKWGGLILREIAFRADVKTLLDIVSCTNIKVEDCRFSPEDGRIDPFLTPVTNGVSVSLSSDVTVTNCDFNGIYRPALLAKSSNLVITLNRMDGIREGINATSVDDVLIQRNELTNFWPRYDKSEHADAIQFWNDGGNTGSHRVEIDDNRIVAMGQRAVQGIFISVQRTAPEHRHSDFKVTRNLVICSAKWGIILNGVDGGLIERNIVLATNHSGSGYKRGQDGGRTSAALTPCISTDSNTTGMRVRNNIAHWYALDKQTTSEGNRQGWPADLVG